MQEICFEVWICFCGDVGMARLVQAGADGGHLDLVNKRCRELATSCRAGSRWPLYFLFGLPMVLRPEAGSQTVYVNDWKPR